VRTLPNKPMLPTHRRTSAVLVAGLLLGGCEYRYPEVAVVNGIGDQVLIREVSFNGCKWPTVLAMDETTSPGRCLVGDDKIHFEKLDIAEYWSEQTDGGLAAQGGVDQGPPNPVPLWFSYQTISVKHVGQDAFYLFRITLDDIEQDFSVPGPYGH
jgi:hypothetical protein